MAEKKIIKETEKIKCVIQRFSRYGSFKSAKTNPFVFFDTSTILNGITKDNVFLFLNELIKGVIGKRLLVKCCLYEWIDENTEEVENNYHVVSRQTFFLNYVLDNLSVKDLLTTESVDLMIEYMTQQKKQINDFLSVYITNNFWNWIDNLYKNKYKFSKKDLEFLNNMGYSIKSDMIKKFTDINDMHLLCTYEKNLNKIINIFKKTGLCPDDKCVEKLLESNNAVDVLKKCISIGYIFNMNVIINHIIDKEASNQKNIILDEGFRIELYGKMYDIDKIYSLLQVSTDGLFFDKEEKNIYNKFVKYITELDKCTGLEKLKLLSKPSLLHLQVLLQFANNEITEFDSYFTFRLIDEISALIDDNKTIIETQNEQIYLLDYLVNVKKQDLTKIFTTVCEYGFAELFVYMLDNKLCVLPEKILETACLGQSPLIIDKLLNMKLHASQDCIKNLFHTRYGHSIEQIFCCVDILVSHGCKIDYDIIDTIFLESIQLLPFLLLYFKKIPSDIKFGDEFYYIVHKHNIMKLSIIEYDDDKQMKKLLKFRCMFGKDDITIDDIKKEMEKHGFVPDQFCYDNSITNTQIANWLEQTYKYKANILSICRIKDSMRMEIMNKYINNNNKFYGGTDFKKFYILP